MAAEGGMLAAGDRKKQEQCVRTGPPESDFAVSLINPEVVSVQVERTHGALFAPSHNPTNDAPSEKPGRSLRVLLVIPQLRIGGAEKQVVFLARQMKARGHEVAVATFYQGGDYEVDLAKGGIPVYVLEKKTRIGWEVVLALQGLLRRGAYDIVHSFLWPANWRVRVAARMAGTLGVIDSTRSFESDLGWLRLLANRFLLPRADVTVVNAMALKRHLADDLGHEEKGIRVIRNGVEAESYQNLLTPEEARRLLNIPIGAKVLGSVGNFEPEKNQEDLLRMLVRVRESVPEACLVLVGRGEREAALRRLSTLLGLEKAVLFVGASRRVPECLSAMDLFLNSSLREGCCNAILEAMAASRAVLAYAVGGNPELVVEGETGYLFPPRDWESMADQAVTLLLNSDQRRALGAAGSRRARTVFKPEETMKHTEGLYYEVLDNKRIPVVSRFVAGTTAHKTTISLPETLAASVIMPVRNEERCIRDALESVLSQDIGSDRFEVLVVDGCSTDGTRDIVREVMSQHTNVRLLENPDRVVPTAMNIGLHEASGKVIVRVDGHCIIGPEYLSSALEVLQRTDCNGVGGTMVAVGQGIVGCAIALGTSSPFGIGNSKFHYSKEEAEVDTFYLGSYRRKYLLEIGAYDRNFVRNQDDELNYRIRARGGRVIYTPRMRAQYHVRPSLGSLFSQYFQYGLWKVPMYRKTQHPWQLRHLVPSAFVMGLLAPLLLAPWRAEVLLIPPLLLALHLLVAVGYAMKTRGPKLSRSVLPLVFLALHTSYGLGFLGGMLRRVKSSNVPAMRTERATPV